MKKIFFISMAACVTLPAMAQKATYSADKELSRWVLDANLMGGLSLQDFTTANSTPNYPNVLNADQGKLTFKNGYAYGGDLQLGVFLGKNRHWGIGSGIMVVQQSGFANLDHYHVEYKNTDLNGNTFRQLITGSNISESIKLTSVNIPVMLKYKNRFSKRWGFTADVGALINLQARSNYNTHSSFDYEAIYKFLPKEGGADVTVYDNSAIPSVNDWMITRAEFLKNNPNGDINGYFNEKRALGFKVGLDQPTRSNSGKVDYTSGSIGLMIQPSFNYFLTNMVALNFGGYYFMQPFKNTAAPAYRLNDGNGNYSSGLSNTTASNNQSFGLNLGVRFFLGGSKRQPVKVLSVDQMPPTECGLCDGSIMLNGLTPNQNVTVDYNLNGNKQPKYTATVQADGKVKLNSLCPGNYSDIVVTANKSSSAKQSIAVGEPILAITAQNPTNPTAPGLSDGSVTIYGLTAGKSVNITYSLDGVPHAPVASTIAADKTVVIYNLGEGRYTNIAATVGKCTAKGTDFTLKAPEKVTPPPPPPPPEVDISTPILFDVDQTDIHTDGYSVIDAAVKALKDDDQSYIYIKGNADTTGPEAHNVTLSVDRAKSVKAALVLRGIDGRRIKTEGDGSRVPVSTNETVDGRQENRRAVMSLRKNNH